MPLKQIQTYLRWRAPRSLNVVVGDKIEKVDRPQNAYAVIEVGNSEITAWSTGTGHPIRYKIKGDDKEHNADNIFALRSKITHTIPF